MTKVKHLPCRLMDVGITVKDDFQCDILFADPQKNVYLSFIEMSLETYQFYFEHFTFKTGWTLFEFFSLDKQVFLPEQTDISYWDNITNKNPGIKHTFPWYNHLNIVKNLLLIWKASRNNFGVVILIIQKKTLFTRI